MSNPTDSDLRFLCPMATCHACDEVRRKEQEAQCPTLDYEDALAGPFSAFGLAALRQLTDKAATELAEAEVEYGPILPGTVMHKVICREMLAALSPSVVARLLAMVERAQRNQRIVDLVCAEGSIVQPSKINPGRVVVVDGRTGLDASERSAEACFDSLFDELDGADDDVWRALARPSHTGASNG